MENFNESEIEQKIHTINFETMEFDIPIILNKDNTKSVYVPFDFNKVLELTSERYDHEDIARYYTDNNDYLKNLYQRFQQKYDNNSFKDFLIFELDAIATAGRNYDIKPMIIYSNQSRERILSIIIEYFTANNYKAVTVEPKPKTFI